MKRFMLTVALTCTLSVSTLAGEMPTVGVTSNTPPPVVAAPTEPGKAPTSPSATSSAEEPGILQLVILSIVTWL
ncbi:MAG TPA: hypothetical protein VFU83_03225 [Pyrinomonadaceae bacterium]|nr:hypothetical protein [Pyrinomonadaceae bacterium]